MIIQYIQHYDRRFPGDLQDVTTDRAAFLCDIMQVAVIHEDQTRLDHVPEKKSEEQPQKIEVHNHFYTNEPEANEHLDY